MYVYQTSIVLDQGNLTFPGIARMETPQVQIRQPRMHFKQRSYSRYARRLHTPGMSRLFVS